MAACSLWSTARTLLREGATLKDKLANESMHLKSATNDTWLGDEKSDCEQGHGFDLWCACASSEAESAVQQDTDGRLRLNTRQGNGMGLEETGRVPPGSKLERHDHERCARGHTESCEAGDGADAVP